MYRLFSRIPKGLEPVADAFKKHVEADGMALVKEATEAATAKAAAGSLTTAVAVSWSFLRTSSRDLIALQPVSGRHHQLAELVYDVLSSLWSCCQA
jgi:alkylhydroperoxidase family enzyme